jgi:general secretion pathway protein E
VTSACSTAWNAWPATPRHLHQRLGLTLHYPVLDSHSLLASTPRFDKVALAQCLKREFVLIEQRPVARCVRRPLRHARLAWIDDACKARRCTWCTPPTWPAFLARHEELPRRRALDHERRRQRNRPLQRLSLTSISEDQSRVVKLVNSTLYDALKSTPATSTWAPPARA